MRCLIPEWFTGTTLESGQLLMCINDSDRPANIPIPNWIEQDRIYTLKEVLIASTDFAIGTLAFRLEEVELLPEHFPYKGYNANRFKLL